MLFRTIIAIAAAAAATPIGSAEDYPAVFETKARTVGVSEEDFGNIKYYAQHAAAAYCNFDVAPNRPIVCKNGACPLVEQSNSTVVFSTLGLKTKIGAYVAVDSTRKEIVLSIRGSNNLRNFIVDVEFPWQNCDLVDKCKVHTGFAKSWGEIKDGVTKAMKAARDQNPEYKLIITGHSLGGAVATLGAAYLRRDGLHMDVYTYGSPRVGNDHFANWMSGEPGGHWRVTHENDPVPRLPPMSVSGFPYRHITPEYWLTGGKSNQNDYSTSQVKVCTGTANTGCNGGTKGLTLAIVSHLHYIGNIAACSPWSLFESPIGA